MPHEHHLISPTQIRSTRAAARSLQEETTVQIRLRTRGLIRRAPGIDAGSTIDAVVSSMRHENAGHPLVALVVAPRLSESCAGARFIDALRSCFELPADVIWGVELPPEPDARYTEGPSVILHATDSRDSFLLRNLVADILFFSAEDVREGELLRNFRSRAPFVIVPHGAPCQEELERIATSIDLGTAVVQSDSRTVVPPPLMPFVLADGEPLAIVGENLRLRAARLSVRHDRRAVFRKDLLALQQRYEAFDREMIETADSCRWPPWAVQMLPARYVELPAGGDDAVHAYAWTTLAECFELTKGALRELCDGEMLEIVLPPDVAIYLQKLSGRIEEIVGYAATRERSFFGAVADAISFILEELPPDQPAWNVTMKRLSDRLGGLR